MVGIAGTIALGIMALAACGLVMMLAIAAPVALANFFHARAHSKKKESLNIGGAMIVIGATIIIVYVFIEAVEPAFEFPDHHLDPVKMFSSAGGVCRLDDVLSHIVALLCCLLE